jgi:thiol-disulfide isomerase/thioredoxin
MLTNGLRLLSFILLSTFWFWSVQLLPAQEIDYQLVPNLEKLNDSSPRPDFSLPDPAGKKISLKDFRGRLVMLNFWASWCVPCREEMPAMERLYQEFRNKGFVVLGVNVRDKREDAFALMKELGVTYTVVFDPPGRWMLAYGAWGLPNTYLIGPDGEGIARLRGHADWYSPGARALIQALLNQKKR